MEFDNQITSGGKLAAIRTYERCILLLVQVLSSSGVEFKPSGFGQRERFESVRSELASRLLQKDKRDTIWKAADELGVDISHTDAGDSDPIVEAALLVAGMPKASMLDDLSPNEIKAAMYSHLDAICDHEPSVVTAREFFRKSLDLIQQDDRTVRRINVVEANFGRLSQYAYELVEEDERIRLHGVGKYLDTMKFRISW